MKPDELKAACDTLTEGNVSEFCRVVGISRPAYYRSANGPRVHDLTAYKVRAAMESARGK